ncbi:MAG: hypothetical protein RQ751_10910 [Longimicrobiales bacterium]|nr:hypothetical protein [Longimicrobiales bacterium]
MTREISWRRLLVEGAVIVGSILLAFGIDAWWDATRDRSRELGYLRALAAEFTSAQDAAIALEPGRVQAARSAASLIRQVQGAARAPEDSLFLWASGLSQQIEFNPPRAVLDDLVSSGETQRIRSDTLRLLLARYPAQLAQVAYADAQAWATWEDRIQPYLEGRIPRVDRLRRGTFGRAFDVPFSPSPHPARWNEVFATPRFEDMLAERWMRLEIARRRFEGTRQLIDALLRAIHEQLGPG